MVPASFHHQTMQLFDHTSDLAVLIQCQKEDHYIYMSANPAFLQATGLAKQDLAGKRVDEVWPASQASQIRERCKSVKLRRQALSYTERIELPGLSLSLDTVLHPLDGGPEAPLCLLAVSRRKQGLQPSGSRRANPWEQSWASLFKHHPYPVFLLDGQGICQRANGASRATIGYDDSELEHSLWFRLVSPDWRDAAIEYFMQAVQGRSVSFDTQVCHKNGTVLEMHVILYPAGTDEAGGEMIAIARDTTLQQRVYRGLRESEERYKTLVEQSPDPILVHSKGTLVFYNKAFAALIGIEDQEMLIGESVFRFIHPDFIPRIRERMKAVAERQLSLPPTEMVFLRLDGTAIDVETKASYITYHHEEAAQVIFRDISERKKAAEAREQIEKLVESSPEAIIVHSGGYVVYANRSAEQLLAGTAEETLPGKAIRELICEEDLDTIIERNRDIYRGKDVTDLTALRLKRLDQTTVDVEVTACLIAFEGKPAIQSVIRDVTKRKQAETALIESREQYRKLIELSPDAIVIHSGHKILYANERAAVMLGALSAQSMAGAPIQKFVHPAYQEAVLSRITNPARLLHNTEIRLLIAGGREITVEGSSVEIRFDGKTAYMVSFRDISERKAAEVKLREANRILHRLSTLDGLTGIANRRHFDEVYEREWKEAARYSSPLSVIMCDIDCFKAYNDLYGHQGGDFCLKQVAGSLEEMIRRPRDFVARYGGEEFIFLLPQTDERGALHVADSVCEAVRLLNIPHLQSKAGDRVTVSLGVAAVVPHPMGDPKTLIEYADKALYTAKLNGRNRAVLYVNSAES